jgi:hypothetical protein
MIRIISHLSWISATLQDPARHSWGNSEAQNPNSMIRRPVLTRKCYFFIAVPMDSCDSKSHSYSVCLSLSIIYSMFYPIIPSLSHHYPIISHIFSRKIPKFWHLQGTAVKSSMAHWSQTGRAACNWHLAIQDIRCYMTRMRYITCIIHVYYIHIIYIIYVCVCAYAYASICIHIEYVYIYICICICTCMYM